MVVIERELPCMDALGPQTGSAVLPGVPPSSPRQSQAVRLSQGGSRRTSRWPSPHRDGEGKEGESLPLTFWYRPGLPASDLI